MQHWYACDALQGENLSLYFQFINTITWLLHKKGSKLSDTTGQQDKVFKFLTFHH